MPVRYATGVDEPPQPRDLGQAMRRGFAKRCPRCGKASIYTSYVKINPTCPACGLELHLQRADDAPPYFTILIVAHIIVPGMLILEQQADPPAWVHYLLWLPLSLVLTLWLLPRVKGALIGFQWAKGMHGFGEAAASSPADAAGLGSPPEAT
jgi:uncharacterized protein (DUF983 family)